MGRAQPCALLASDRTLEPSPVRLSGVCGRQDMAGRASTSAAGDDWTFEIDVWYDSGVEETAQFHRRRARWRSPCQPSLHRGRGGGLEQLLRSPRRPMTAGLRHCGLPAYRRSPLDPGWQPWPGRRPGRGCSGSTLLMNVRVRTTHRTSLWVRLCGSLPVLDPRLRERVQTQDFCPDLESWEPRTGQMPLKASEILGFRVPQSRNP